jgi:hypothetical protein
LRVFARLVAAGGLLALLCVAESGGASGAPADPVRADDGSRVLPRPNRIALVPGCSVPAGAVLAGWAANPRLLPAARDLVVERWSALGVRSAAPAIPIVLAERLPRPAPPAAPSLHDQAYRLTIGPRGVGIVAGGAPGAFYAAMTLAQLMRDGRIPCGTIDDAPALQWRILSDDVSRGPLPTMRYFKERIRTIAAFKMNGYSPYMEHVFVAPAHPLPAPLDGITPAQLRELDAYARRYHVAFVPEQQTFAHMHETLRWEKYAPLAETPHGYLLAPSNPAGEAYVRDLIRAELQAVPHAPFFHIGSDEPSDLGRGASRALVDQLGEGPVYVRHVVDTAKFVIAHGGGRPMIWDDALSRHPELFTALPREMVFVNWHYGDEKTYAPYIERIAKGGFDQMVAPGALNWNEIYPDIDQAVANIGRFVDEGKAARVLGLFQTVWHDDGETLFEATWYPVLYAAASAWESGHVDAARYARDFPAAFFGTTDGRFGEAMAALGSARTLLRNNPREYGDYLFWADPFDPALADIATKIDAPAVRLRAETAIEGLRTAAPPPLHANAASVMLTAALRYDLLARRLQIAHEARDYYDGARAQADGKHDGLVYRGLFVTKYLFWEERDRLLELVPLVRAAWEYENRPSHELSVLERYRVAADRAIDRAGRIQSATYEYVAHRPLPAFDEALGR